LLFAWCGFLVGQHPLLQWFLGLLSVNIDIR
jgi:hypothetical protein